MRPLLPFLAIAALHCAPPAHAACVDLDQLAAASTKALLPQEIAFTPGEDPTSLLSGWGPVVPQAGVGGMVWADEDVSTLEVGMPFPVDVAASMRLLAPRCDSCGPQTVVVSVNGKEVARPRLDGGHVEEVPFSVRSSAWKAGTNLVALRWGWRRAPSELDPRSTLTRPVAAALIALRLARTAGDGQPPPGLGPLELPADAAVELFLKVPEGSRLEGTLGRAAASRRGAAGIARISMESDDAPPVTLASRALAGLSRQDWRFALDLTSRAGSVVGISIALEASEPGSGLVGAVRDLRLCSERAFDAADAFGAWSPPAEPDAPSAAGDPPSVLLYLMDALRARSLGSYGAPEISSPHLDRLARSGVTLARQVSQASNTPPSVKAILTGRYLPRTGNAALPPSVPTLAERFAAAGYRTGVFTSSPWIGAVGGFRGFSESPRDLYFGTVDYWLDQGSSTPGEKRYAGAITDRLAAFASAAAGPTFVYAHTIHPHNPYAPPAPFGELGRRSQHWEFRGDTKTLLDIQKGMRTPDRNEAAELSRLYHLDVLYNDHEVGRLLRRLATLPAWHDAVVAFTSDHGDELLEHGGVLHGFTSYAELVDVPAILAAPGRLPAGRTVGELTESVDLAPTLLSLAGLPALPGAEGHDLRPAIERGGGAEGRRRAYSSASSAPGIYTVIAWPHKYVWAPRDGKLVGLGEGAARTRSRTLLFDLDADPEERHDLRATRPVLARYLHQSLLAWLAATDATGSQPDAPMDDESRRLLESLGYLGG